MCVICALPDAISVVRNEAHVAAGKPRDRYRVAAGRARDTRDDGRAVDWGHRLGLVVQVRGGGHVAQDGLARCPHVRPQLIVA